MRRLRGGLHDPRQGGGPSTSSSGAHHGEDRPLRHPHGLREVQGQGVPDRHGGGLPVLRVGHPGGGNGTVSGLEADPLCTLVREGDQRRDGDRRPERVDNRGRATNFESPRAADQVQSHHSSLASWQGQWCTLPAKSGLGCHDQTGGREPRAPPEHDDGVGVREEGQALSGPGVLPYEPLGKRCVLTSEEVNLLTSAPDRHTASLFQDLEQSSRLFLLEVCCDESSALGEAAEKVGLSYFRAGLFNQHDLTDPHGPCRVLDLVRARKPKHVWISTECSSFSPMQNLNQRTPEQVKSLKQKQHEARKQHVAAMVVAYWGRHHGAEVHWEWSRRCRAWKWPNMDRFRSEHNTHTAIVGGCRVGLRDKKSGHLVGKEWRIETTSELFARNIHIPCLQASCEGPHVVCESHLTRMSAFYTPKFASRMIHYMQQVPHVSQDMQNRCKGDSLNMLQCQCHVFKCKGVSQTCPACMFQWLQDSSDAHVNQDTHASQVEDHMYNLYGQRPSAKALVQEELTTEFTAAERERWLHKIRLLHGATGHGSKDVLKQALVKRGVDKRVVQLVDEFRCSVCEERKRPAPRRVATLEVHPERWKVMLADGAHWVHPGSKVRNVIGLYMDQNSRFLVGKVLVQHKTHLPNAETYIRFFQEHWQQYFGKPEILRYDAEGTWRSKALDSAFSDMGIMLDPVPGDAHWHISPLERSIAWVKECLSKLALQEPQMDTQAALASALEAWNNREVVRGFSPRQHALGQVPDPCGRLFESDVKGLPVHMMGNPEGEIAQHQKLREEAEVAFTRWQAQQRLSRAINSKERKIPEFAPGDLVFYWRTQLQGKWSNYALPQRERRCCMSSTNRSRCHGP